MSTLLKLITGKVIKKKLLLSGQVLVVDFILLFKQVNGIMDKLKKFLLIFSVVMFCYQFKTAIENLISPNLVDSTSIKNVEEINFPLITICPTNQLNKAKLKELEYVDFSNVLYGLQGNNASWGAVKNLTFLQVLEQVFN